MVGTHLRRVVLLGYLDELDGDRVIVQLRYSFDESSDVYHDGASSFCLSGQMRVNKQQSELYDCDLA